LIGRSSELDQLTELLAATSQGRGTVALVEGEPGIGKTRLVQEAAAVARALGLPVHAATADELEQDRPFGLVADVLGLHTDARDPERARIAGMLAPGDGGEGAGAPSGRPEIRFAIVESIVRLVERLASDDPVALVLEDVHWADPSTLLTLHRLVGAAVSLPVAILFTCRPIPRPPELERLLDRLRERGGVRLELGALGPEDVAELARQHLGAVAGPRLRELVSRAGGNPLFVDELVNALQKEGLIVTSVGRAEIGEASLPPSLPLTIIRGLSYLSDETLRALRVASVLGSSFSPADLSIVLHTPVTDLLAVLGEALASRVLLERQGELAFRHDLIRNAIYEDMTEAVRTAIHAQAGRSLADAGRPVAQVATHLALGARTGDVVAIEWLRKAAGQAMFRAPRIAVELLRRAVELAGQESQIRDDTEAVLLDALFAAGSLNEAEQVGRALLARGLNEDVDMRARIGLTKVLQLSGKSDEAAAELQRLADDPRLSTRDRARMFGLYVFNRAWLEPDGAASSIAEAEALGDRLGDGILTYWTTIASASLALVQGRLADGADFGARAGRMALELGREALEYGLISPPVTHLIEADRLDEAERTLQAGAWAAEELGWRWQALRHVWLSVLPFLRGDWGDAAAQAETSLTLMEETGARINADLPRFVLFVIALHRDDLRGASGHVRRFGETDEGEAARALVWHAKGNRERCRKVLDRWVPKWVLGSSLEIHRRYGLDVVPLLLWVGDAKLARTLTERMEEMGDRAGVPSASGAALYCRGLVKDDADLLLDAVRAYERSPRLFELARAREAAGSSLSGKNRLGEAIDQLEQAVSAYERVGAARGIARTEATLRRLGVRRGRRGSRARPSTGWGSLTPTEVKVARLIAEGLLYQEVAARLFISRRTVETHVAHMFAKLGVSSRSQLAEIARDHT
jgi:DNA-binding CsgD family transcriptional regulator